MMQNRHPTYRRRCITPSLVRWEAPFVAKIILLTIFLQQYCVESWTMNHPLTSRQQLATYRKRSFVLNDVQVKEVDMNQPENVSVSTALANNEMENSEDDDDDDEYEYVEFDSLTEQEFIGSEWIVGTNWDKNPNKIDETWTRLIVDKDGKNIAVWGDDSKGTWTFDVPSQFLSISKENILAGKQIWACTISDYYYLQGTVRGWTYWSAAAVIGQWQAKRLGVDKEEAGTPPWFMTTEQEASASDDESNNNTSTDLTTTI
jgi:hypothetical protein